MSVKVRRLLLMRNRNQPSVDFETDYIYISDD